MVRNDANKMSEYREPTLDEAMRTIARQAIRISQYEADNAALRAEVESYRNDSAQLRIDTVRSSPPLETRSASDNDDGGRSRTSSESREDLASKCAELQTRLLALESKHAKCAPYILEVNRKYNDAKHLVIGWKDHLERHGYIKSRKEPKSHDPQPGPIQRLDDDETTPRALTAGNQRTKNLDGLSDVSLDPPPSSPTRDRLPRVTSSQTTVDEPNEEHARASADNLVPNANDEPESVSARSTKRKAGASTLSEPSRRRVKIKEEPQSPDAPIELSSDPLSDPQKTPRRLRLAEMSDLDAVGPVMITPRLHRRARDVMPRAVSEELVKPATLLTRRSSSFSGRDSLGGPPESDTMTKQQHGVQSSREPERLNQPSALRPLSVNVPTPQRASDKTNGGRTRHRRTSSKSNVALVSEDGDDRASQNSNANAAKYQSDGVKPQDLRLEELLNEPPTEQVPAFTRRPAQKAANKSKAAQSPNKLPTPVSLDKRKSPEKRKSPQKYAHGSRSPSLIEPNEEPLRIRDPKTLQLTDFKIDPKYMGTDFAFADTVRGRDQRRGLHACTRPECCGGALKKAVSIGGPTLSGKTDTQALEAYLGKDWTHHIKAYAEDQRKEVTLQAHAFCFAEQHGKHRHAFERRQTPPGFWNTDFPTTQETEQNRIKAQEMEREEVMNRWREALRVNGRWKFRDE